MAGFLFYMNEYANIRIYTNMRILQRTTNIRITDDGCRRHSYIGNLLKDLHIRINSYIGIYINARLSPFLTAEFVVL